MKNTDADQANDPVAGFLTSSMSRSSGKTVVSMGLAATLSDDGHHVQCFKKGPDYIDPIWLARASHRPCFNLDPILQTSTELDDTFHRERRGASTIICEGSQGLHDGLLEDWTDSNASLARRLGLPVVLVIDATGMNRTVAALVNGLVEFDTNVKFNGIILNRVKTDRHERKLRQVIEGHTPLRVLGAIPNCESLHIAEAELGLLPAQAHGAVDLKIARIAREVRLNCDVDAIAGERRSLENNDSNRATTVTTSHTKTSSASPRRKVAIARDEAFQFYYEDDLAKLAARGIELFDVSPLHDDFPDNLDGLIIGGGFPERFANLLAANTGFRRDLRLAVDAGLAVRAECAGLMYLCRSIIVKQTDYPMCNVLDAVVTLQDRPVGRGYMRLESMSCGTTGTAIDDPTAFNAHEFHHSRIVFDEEPDYAYRVTRGHGTDGIHDGVVLENVIASYAHFRNTNATPWIDWFIAQLDGKSYAPNRHIVESSQHV